MSTSSTRRSFRLATVAAVCISALFAFVSQAGAASYYACIKKKSGAAHIFTSKPKCKHGETKLSWNTTGPAGQNGANGKNGTNGANGTNGSNGQNLTSQTPIASGQTESGAFAVAAGESKTGYAATGITFPQPLPKPIAEEHVVYLPVKMTTPQCPGVGRAAAGFVCMYESEASGITFLLSRDFALDLNAADPFGFAAFFSVTAASGYAAGVWTVTAG